MFNRQNPKKLRPDLIFFIIGFLIFPLVIIYSIYSIFSVKDDITPISSPIDNMNVSIVEVPKKENGNITECSINESAEPMTSSISTVKTGHSEDGFKKSQQSQQQINHNGIWLPTQYSQGDIVKNTYVVQLGDTLWQIANAYYGNGSDWIKILEANKDSIGILPNGEQALIIPGQTLNLP